MSAERARRAKVDKWPVVRVHRSQINPAAYNPRTIDKAAADGLQHMLKTHGLADKLTLNRRSSKHGFEEESIVTPSGETLWVGTLVGGHQRLKQIDAMEKDQDYALEVILVDVDLKQEMEMNGALNNPAIQGQTDADKLEELIKLGKDQFNYENAGYSAMDLQSIFDLSFVLPENEAMFSAEKQSEAAQSTLAGAEELTQEKLDERARKEAEKIAKIKEKKKEAREKAQGQDDSNFYAYVVFQNREQLELFQNATGTDTKYTDGQRLLSMMGLPTSN